jgi:hypothetical protein
MRELATPLLLWAFGTIFIVFLGFMHGGSDHPVSVSAVRFSHPLPSDNDMPQYFADWWYHHGHDEVAPIYPDQWLSGDRPPLQSAYVLSQRTFAWDGTGLHYEILGVVLQQLWIVGLWALLCSARIRGPTRALAMIAVLVSDVAIVHSFYVWPKLLAASFLLAAAALLIDPAAPTLRHRPWALALIAGLFSLAFLAHGAALFAVIPLATLALVRGLPSWRWVGAGVLAALLLLAPWSAYQRYFDPPGNRLAKWMLAGDVPIDSRGTGEAIRDSYSQAGWGGVIHNKKENFVQLTEGPDAVSETADGIGDLVSGDAEDGVRTIRFVRFRWILPALGLLIAAPFAMAVGWIRGSRDPDDWRFAIFSLTVVTAGCVAWALLLWGSLQSRPSIHIGSLALPILAMAGAVAGLRATFPRLAAVLVVANVISVLALYAPALDTVPGSGYSVTAAVFAAAGLAGFSICAFGAAGVFSRRQTAAALASPSAAAP